MCWEVVLYYVIKTLCYFLKIMLKHINFTIFSILKGTVQCYLFNQSAIHILGEHVSLALLLKEGIEK